MKKRLLDPMVIGTFSIYFLFSVVWEQQKIHCFVVDKNNICCLLFGANEENFWKQELG